VQLSVDLAFSRKNYDRGVLCSAASLALQSQRARCFGEQTRGLPAVLTLPYVTAVSPVAEPDRMRRGARRHGRERRAPPEHRLVAPVGRQLLPHERRLRARRRLQRARVLRVHAGAALPARPARRAAALCFARSLCVRPFSHWSLVYVGPLHELTRRTTFPDESARATHVSAHPRDFLNGLTNKATNNPCGVWSPCSARAVYNTELPRRRAGHAVARPGQLCAHV